MGMILSLLLPGELAREARGADFPKWNTLCLLKSLMLPTLDAAFLLPGATQAEIATLVEQFARLLGRKQLLVRSDGGRESTQYFWGGNTLALSKVVQLACGLASQGRAVILMEPTDRFRNRISIQFLACAGGNFTVEILGPGFDASDINRGGILPQYTIEGYLWSWREYHTLGLPDVIIRRNSRLGDDLRRQQRLRNLGTKILPSIGVRVIGSADRFAERWLRMRGYDELWQNWTFIVDLVQIQSWYDDAFLVADHLSHLRSWKAFVLCGSVLADGRFIYWDVVDGSKKWQAPTSRVSSRS